MGFLANLGKGKVTYLSALAIIAVALLRHFDVITDELANLVIVACGGTGLAGLRRAVPKEGAAPPVGG